MADSKVNDAKANYQNLADRYASIQSAAYTSKSAKSEDIEKLQADMKSYFDAEKSDKGDKIVADLGQMHDMALAHEKDASHTDDATWDKIRDEMDGFIKDAAPTEEKTAVATAVDAIPKGGSSSGTTNLLATGGAGAAAGSFGSMTMISADAMVQKFPQLAPYKAAIQSAADKYGVPAQLLMAQAMQESHANPSEPGGGMFQFIPGTWAGQGGGEYTFNAGNVQHQAEMAAKYDVQCMKDNGNDLNKALRNYNGPVADGANSKYQEQIQKWMKGIDGYTG